MAAQMAEAAMHLGAYRARDGARLARRRPQPSLGEPRLPTDSLECFAEDAAGAVPLTPVSTAAWPALEAKLDGPARAWLKSLGFTAEAGTHAPIPDASGGLARIVAGVAPQDPIWALAPLPEALPEGVYALDGIADGEIATQYALGWALGAYAFTRYRARRRPAARAIAGEGI